MTEFLPPIPGAPEPNPVKPEPDNQTNIPWPKILVRGLAAVVVSAAVVAYKDLHDDLTEVKHQLSAQTERLRAQGSQLHRVADISGQTLGIDTATITGAGLRNPRSLIDFGSTVSTSRSDELARSSLSLMVRKKGSKDSWQQTCNGAKVRLYNNDYVETAGHCLNYSFHIPKNDKHTAENIINTDPYEYSVARPANNVKDPAFNVPIGIITGASVPLDYTDTEYNTDVTLLKIKPLKTPSQVQSYTRVPALDINNTDKQPIQGEEVALYSTPVSVGQLAVAAKGIYLGSSTYPGSPSDSERIYDIVGLKVSDARKDPLEFGGSGSFSNTASGYKLGPYVRGVTDPRVTHEPRSENSTAQQMRDSTISRLKLEKDLEIDLSTYTDIGFFTKGSATINKALVSGLKYMAKPSLKPKKVHVK